MVVDKYGDEYDIEYIDGTYLDVLNKVKNYCNVGFKLLSHPLSGSVKPKETPYKSVMISKKSGDYDLMSLEIIDNAICTYNKFNDKNRIWSEKVLEDFMLIDHSLISSAIESANRSNL